MPTSSDRLAISVRSLSKRYPLGRRRWVPGTLGEAVLQRLKHPFRGIQDEAFWALDDVSFTVDRGEVLGIIGGNGAGKTTLLKILSRITEPTAGEVHLHGRVGSLLEVGTGFHGQLTGRENISLSGRLLGMRRREIDRCFDAIVAFSEIERFLDTAVRHYSSGMYVRLAFAVAAHLSAEILMVDEVLAVGDAAFQAKCLGKIHDVAHGGRTVLFVSHSEAAVRRLCSSAIFLQQGRVAYAGATDTAFRHYRAHLGDSAAGFSDARRVRSSPVLRIVDAWVTVDGTRTTELPLSLS